MRGDAVEEPPVVAYHHGTTGEILETFLESSQRIDINVVCRLVKQQHIALLFQSHGKVQSVSLSAGQHTNLFLLIGTGEIEP